MKSLKTGTLVLGLVLGALSACESSEPDRTNSLGRQGDGVFGGSVLTHASPISRFIVGLQFENADGGVSTCTATLISRSVILTAAHCVPIKKESLEARFLAQLEARFLAHNLAQEDDGTKIKIDRILVHPRYREGVLAHGPNPFDMAVMLLHAAAPETAKPMRLQKQKFNAADVETTYIAGFGAESYNRESGESSGDERLKLAIVVPKSGSVDGVLQMDQTKGSGACIGDSGGPAFYQSGDAYVQIGILGSVNNPNGDDSCRGFSNYASVVASADWIAKALDLMTNHPVIPTARSK